MQTQSGNIVDKSNVENFVDWGKTSRKTIKFIVRPSFLFPGVTGCNQNTQFIKYIHQKKKKKNEQVKKKIKIIDKKINKNKTSHITHMKI